MPPEHCYLHEHEPEPSSDQSPNLDQAKADVIGVGSWRLLRYRWAHCHSSSRYSVNGCRWWKCLNKRWVGEERQLHQEVQHFDRQEDHRCACHNQGK